MEQYIQPFIETTVNVFRDFCKIELEKERIFFIEKNDFHSWDISGIIGLTGEAAGAVAISMKVNTAARITALLTNEPHKTLDDDVIDAMGEIINIIAGNAKKNLEDTFRLTISLPTVIKGAAHTVVWPVDRTRIVCIPFRVFSDQQICLSVAISTKS